MIATSSSHLVSARRKFIEAGGHTTQSFGLGRIVGQIYALLYLNPHPLCLDEIADELSVSKASVSTTVRQLQQWSAVKRVWVKGDRKDYYEAETDFKAMLVNGLLSTVRKKVDTAGNQLLEIEETLSEIMEKLDGAERKDLEIVVQRLQRAKQFHGNINGLLNNPLINHML